MTLTFLLHKYLNVGYFCRSHFQNEVRVMLLLRPDFGTEIYQAVGDKPFKAGFGGCSSGGYMMEIGEDKFSVTFVPLLVVIEPDSLDCSLPASVRNILGNSMITIEVFYKFQISTSINVKRKRFSEWVDQKLTGEFLTLVARRDLSYQASTGELVTPCVPLEVVIFDKLLLSPQKGRSKKKSKKKRK